MSKVLWKERGDRTVLSFEKSANVLAEQKRKGRDEKQPVKPVRNTTVSGEQCSVTLGAKAAFDSGQGKISKLTNN